MTLRIITGTITDAKDPFGRLEEMKEAGLFYKWHWNGDDIGWTYEPSHVVSSDQKKFSIIQTTGSGKTILLALYLYRAHLNQIRTGANFSLKWTENNKGKEKSAWQPVLQSMEDFEEAKYMHLGIDDIRGTISGWNCKEGKIISALSLLSRKFGDWVDVSTQRLENFIPPDMRYITDEYVVPYIRCVDETRRAPDGRGTPLELISMRFSPGYELLDYSLYSLNNPVGMELLDSYDTLQVAQSLKADGSVEKPRTNQPGYQLEVKAFEYLKQQVPGMKWEHLNGKHQFDIVSDTHAFDVCGTDPSGELILDHKDFLGHIKVAKIKSQKPYLMYESGGDWRFIPINYNLNNLVDGKRINIRKIDLHRVRMLKSVFS